MIVTAHIEMSLNQPPDFLGRRDHRILAGAHQALLSRPGVVGCDLSTLGGPVVFVVTLANDRSTTALSWHIEKLIDRTLVRVVYPIGEDGFAVEDVELTFRLAS